MCLVLDGQIPKFTMMKGLLTRKEKIRYSSERDFKKK